MPEVTPAIKASVGFASETGPRERNEDFAGAVFGMELPKPRRDIIAAIADGIGGAKGGRVAAETAVRGFLDGFCDLPETMEVGRAGATVLNALNSWIFSQGRRDNKLSGMGCTFTAVVLRGLPLARRSLNLLDHRSRARGRWRPIQYSHPRARRRD
jgi:serine/threonine protein phosphatase PrpC